HLGGRTLRLRAPDVLRFALQLLRHGIRLLRREKADPQWDRRSGGRIRLSTGGDHRGGTVAAKKCAATDDDAGRRRSYGIARDERRPRYLGGRSTCAPNHGSKNAGKWRVRPEPILKHGAPRSGRRS